MELVTECWEFDSEEILVWVRYFILGEQSNVFPDILFGDENSLGGECESFLNVISPGDAFHLPVDPPP